MESLLKFIGYDKKAFKESPVSTIFNVLVTIFIWILVVILIYQLVLKITGHSPEEIEILKKLVYLVLSLEIKNTYTLGRLQGRLDSKPQ